MSPGWAAGSGTSGALPACTAGLGFVTEDLNPCFKGNKKSLTLTPSLLSPLLVLKVVVGNKPVPPARPWPP